MMNLQVACPPEIILLWLFGNFEMVMLHRVDLCRQATDRDEEEDDDEESLFQYSKLPSFIPSGANDKHRKWFVSFKRWRVHGRQKIVVLVRTLIYNLLKYGPKTHILQALVTNY